MYALICEIFYSILYLSRVIEIAMLYVPASFVQKCSLQNKKKSFLMTMQERGGKDQIKDIILKVCTRTIYSSVTLSKEGTITTWKR